MDKVIVVKGLQKHYGTVHAVKGIDFYVEKGKLFAFLGPNGAGKSTTINMITTLLSVDEGTIEIEGKTVGVDDVSIRDRIGIVFQDHFLDALLTVEENLRTRASFYGGNKDEIRKRVDDAMKVVDIVDLAKRPYGKLSGGQRRRTDIARALVNRPDILFLDEPTTGLDPQTRKNVWETIRELQKQLGMTVFLTTHYMEEAAVADYVVVIDDGSIAAKGTPEQLKEAFATDSLRVTPLDMAKAEAVFASKNQPYRIEQGVVIVDLDETLDALPWIEALKDNIKNVQILNGTMDDVFIKITGREMR
jgi:multidrug/hemolysin transport system ATP-binding protein